MNRYYVKLTAISPIHIGSGEVYEPTNYVIDDGYLYEFNEVLFYKKLPDNDKKQMLSIIERNNRDSVFRLFNFIKARKKTAIECSYRKVKISSGVYEHYKTKFGKPTQVSNQEDIKEFNQFLIERSQVLKNKNKLYIPGSSIKGAIVTAYMEYLLKHNIQKFEYFKKEKLSQELLVSDTFPLRVFELIGYALNKEKFEDDMIGPRKFIEVIFSNHKDKSEFEFYINLKKYDNKFKYHIDIKEIIKAINSHYLPIYKKMFEYSEIKKVLGKGFKSTYENLKLKENQFLIRLGRHSGAEAMTIDEMRKILVTIALIQNKTKEGNDSFIRIQRLHKKSRYESDELENLIVDFGRLNDKEKQIFRTFDNFYYEPKKLENLVKRKSKLTIKAILSEATTMWLFGFGGHLKKDSHLPFGWAIGEIKEV